MRAPKKRRESTTEPPAPTDTAKHDDETLRRMSLQPGRDGVRAFIALCERSMSRNPDFQFRLTNQ